MKKLSIVWTLAIAIISMYNVKAQELIDVTKQAQEVGALVDKKADHPWEFGAGFQVIINQSFSKNWVGASNPTIGGQILGNMYLRYQKDKLAWENILDLDYGMRVTFNPKPPKGAGTKIEKVSDNLDFKSKLGYKAGGFWYYGAMFTLNTQMTNGYDPDNDTLLTSSIMTPGYFTLSVGMDYKRKMWSWYISPIGAKMISKANNRFLDEDKFGVLKGKKLYTAVGASTHIVFNADIHPKIKLYTKLELFYDYLGEYKQLRNLDARWDMTWMFNLTDWLSLSLKFAMLYDYDIKFNVYDVEGNQLFDREGNARQTDHLQFQESFGLTLGYKFQVPKKK